MIHNIVYRFNGRAYETSYIGYMYMLIDRYDGVHILDRWAEEEEEEAMNGEKRTIAFPSLVCVRVCVCPCRGCCS